MSRAIRLLSLTAIVAVAVLAPGCSRAEKDPGWELGRLKAGLPALLVARAQPDGSGELFVVRLDGREKSLWKGAPDRHLKVLACDEERGRIALVSSEYLTDGMLMDRRIPQEELVVLDAQGVHTYPTEDGMGKVNSAAFAGKALVVGFGGLEARGPREAYPLQMLDTKGRLTSLEVTGGPKGMQPKRVVPMGDGRVAVVFVDISTELDDYAVAGARLERTRLVVSGPVVRRERQTPPWLDVNTTAVSPDKGGVVMLESAPGAIRTRHTLLKYALAEDGAQRSVLATELLPGTDTGSAGSPGPEGVVLTKVELQRLQQQKPDGASVIEWLLYKVHPAGMDPTNVVLRMRHTSRTGLRFETFLWVERFGSR